MTDPTMRGKHKLRGRVRRVHVITAGVVVAVLAAGGVAWATLGGGDDSDPSTPGLAGDEGAGDDAGAGAPAAGPAPVPTWTEPGRGGDGNRWPLRPGRGNNRGEPVPGMPTDLSAERNGDNVVLQWTDNSTNEDGFALFVTQGRASFQIVVAAGTTRYEGAAGGQDTSTCFSVVPFTFTSAVSNSPAGWACTARPGRDGDGDGDSGRDAG